MRSAIAQLEILRQVLVLNLISQLQVGEGLAPTSANCAKRFRAELHFLRQVDLMKNQVVADPNQPC